VRFVGMMERNTTLDPYKDNILLAMNVILLICFGVFELHYQVNYSVSVYQEKILVIFLLVVVVVLLLVTRYRQMTNFHKIGFNVLSWSAIFIFFLLFLIKGIEVIDILFLLTILIILFATVLEERVLILFIGLFFVTLFPIVTLLENTSNMKVFIIAFLVLTTLIFFLMAKYERWIKSDHISINNTQKDLIMNSNVAFAIHRMIIDEDGDVIDFRIVDVNGGFEKIMGYRKADIIGSRFLEVFPTIDSLLFQKYVNVVKKQESISFLNPFKHFGMVLHVNAYPIDQIHMVTIFLDVTEIMSFKEKQKTLVESADYQQLL